MIKKILICIIAHFVKLCFTSFLPFFFFYIHKVSALFRILYCIKKIPEIVRLKRNLKDGQMGETRIHPETEDGALLPGDTLLICHRQIWTLSTSVSFVHVIISLIISITISTHCNRHRCHSFRLLIFFFFFFFFFLEMKKKKITKKLYQSVVWHRSSKNFLPQYVSIPFMFSYQFCFVFSIVFLENQTLNLVRKKK